jgi:E3 ubiquitin-protein ligase synoviolin
LAQRPNFYSAAVYLAQSSANLMILTNLLFVIACSFLLGLQKLLYGTLRPIEVEQLYEKAWFAVTETCLAMTVFRGELGLTFCAMFFALLTGKVWGWIGEGRVEILEQQPPRNPRLFHTRLALSLGLSVAFDLTMLEYVVRQVMRQARPDMMVMFGFEFAVLATISMSTAFRYAINLIEIGVVQGQKKQRIEEIKRERVEAAITAHQQARTELATTSSDTTDTTTPTPTQRTLEQVTQEALNQPFDDNDVEVEGWEDKGRWMFYLNLATDFFKLVIYLAFFFILLVFYGLPIHILRDVFLTMRSFMKRITDFMKYRTATRDMNARYPDATAEEIGREDVCIICREEMRPYQPPVAVPGQPQPRANPVAERMRPKKLPCGHVLHFSCLRSWLERQQICPTCRANVVNTGTPGTTGVVEAGAGQNGQHPPADRPGPRVYQFGPLRIGIGAARGNNMFEELQQQLEGGVGPRQPQFANNANPNPNGTQQFGVGLRWGGMRRRQTEDQNMTTLQRIDALQARTTQEIQALEQTEQELTVLRALQLELERLRGQRTTIAASGLPPAPTRMTTLEETLGSGQEAAIPAGSDRLPTGVTLPEGWTLLPLHPQQHGQHMGPATIARQDFQFGPLNVIPQGFQLAQQLAQQMQAAQMQMIVQDQTQPAAGAQNAATQPPVPAPGSLPHPGQAPANQGEIRFDWPQQWGMPDHQQIHQQVHQHMHQNGLQQHQQAHLDQLQQHQRQHEQTLAQLQDLQQQETALRHLATRTNGTPAHTPQIDSPSNNSQQPRATPTTSSAPTSNGTSTSSAPGAANGVTPNMNVDANGLQQPEARRPLPSWGSSALDFAATPASQAPAAQDASSSLAASAPTPATTTNGTHGEEEAYDAEESNAGPSVGLKSTTVEQKAGESSSGAARNPTVEDIAEDVD